MKTRIIITALVTLFLAACTTTDPYTGEDKVRKSVKYGAAGAVVCGLIGATRNSKSARNAAAGCGAIGAGIGAYMDHQEKELREELEGTGVRVVREGDQIQLIMPSNITFNTDEYLIKNEFYSTLDSVGKVLYKYKDTQLDVIGHTDSTGNDNYNMTLSQRRANSVASYLENNGIQGNRLTTIGMGETQPIADNNTVNGRAQNRRVELYVTAAPDY
ncbi:OmpA family protein [Marinicella gelatinilytica]|uniref:OmpA family protein n=1 Tax=Marinicella gelatinilytica TaxID=2996017 RepID=UPI002260A324|nr:OmpA family protein [Marinicella gelatinilytica]MCX7546038.1 OmpA family protein [Marinicella gelatinilytica]